MILLLCVHRVFARALRMVRVQCSRMCRVLGNIRHAATTTTALHHLPIFLTQAKSDAKVRVATVLLEYLPKVDTFIHAKRTPTSLPFGIILEEDKLHTNS